MGFQIDWVTFGITLILAISLYHVINILVAYLKYKNTKRKIKILDGKLAEINQQLEQNKGQIEKALKKNMKN